MLVGVRQFRASVHEHLLRPLDGECVGQTGAALFRPGNVDGDDARFGVDERPSGAAMADRCGGLKDRADFVPPADLADFARGHGRIARVIEIALLGKTNRQDAAQAVRLPRLAEHQEIASWRVIHLHDGDVGNGIHLDCRPPLEPGWIVSDDVEGLTDLRGERGE